MFNAKYVGQSCLVCFREIETSHRCESNFFRWFNKHLIKRRWKRRADRKTNEVSQAKCGRERERERRSRQRSDAWTKAVLLHDSFVRSFLPVRESRPWKTPPRVVVREKFKSRIRGETEFVAAPTARRRGDSQARVVREFTGRESDG